MEYIHAKRKGKKGKGKGHFSSFLQNNGTDSSASVALPKDFEVAFKWVPVEGLRISSGKNKVIYEEYKQVRADLLKETVYNPDGTENKEGISRLRQAGLNDKAIYETVGKGKTPNGYNYHHLFPRVLSGSLAKGPIQLGDEKISSIHDWRCLMPLPNSTNKDIHMNVHKAMEERNGPLPPEGFKTTYYIAMPLSSKEYEMYRQNPKSVKAELLIVSGKDYRTVDQRDNAPAKTMSVADIARMKMAKGR